MAQSKSVGISKQDCGSTRAIDEGEMSTKSDEIDRTVSGITFHLLYGKRIINTHEDDVEWRIELRLNVEWNMEWNLFQFTPSSAHNPTIQFYCSNSHSNCCDNQVKVIFTTSNSSPCSHCLFSPIPWFTTNNSSLDISFDLNLAHKPGTLVGMFKEKSSWK